MRDEIGLALRSWSFGHNYSKLCKIVHEFIKPAVRRFLIRTNPISYKSRIMLLLEAVFRSGAGARPICLAQARNFRFVLHLVTFFTCASKFERGKDLETLRLSPIPAQHGARRRGAYKVRKWLRTWSILLVETCDRPDGAWTVILRVRVHAESPFFARQSPSTVNPSRRIVEYRFVANYCSIQTGRAPVNASGRSGETVVFQNQARRGRKTLRGREAAWYPYPIFSKEFL